MHEALPAIDRLLVGNPENATGLLLKVEALRALDRCEEALVIIERLMARAQQDDVKKRLIELTNDAVVRGAFGSPTFFVGTEMFFGKDQLRDVEEEIVEQKGRMAKAG